MTLSKIGSPSFPNIQSKINNSTTSEIDTALKLLEENKDNWIRTDVSERINILNEINHDMLNYVNEWIQASINAKGVKAGTFEEGEEWIVLSLVFRNLRLLKNTLTNILNYGQPRKHQSITTRADGQVVVKVFPMNYIDKLLFKDVTGEVWMQPDISQESLQDYQSCIYKSKSQKGSVCLVLGAGNLAMLPVIDIMYKLFVENKVVALKMNPVNAYLGQILEKGFHALIKRGFLQIIYGGINEGSYLCNHEKIEELHLTGSDKTFEAIVFGTGEAGSENKRQKKQILNKPFTAELGNITPVIIVPGPWKNSDIKEQGFKLASWLVVNAGFNCLTPRVIIQHKNWNQRNDLVNAISDALQSFETRKAYYPGAKERHMEFISEHPNAKQFGNDDENNLPWTFINDVDSGNKNDICFKNEAFCGLFAETAIEASDVSEYLKLAVDFANETLWGSLTVVIFVHPKSLKDPEIAKALDHAIADLKYGSICVNLRTEYSYLLMVTTWGAFPEHEIYDIQSGTGVVNNALMFEKPQKSVIRGPFKMWPDPFKRTNKNLPEFGKNMTYFEASSSALKLPGVMWSAIKS